MLRLFDNMDNMFRQIDAMFNYPLSTQDKQNGYLKKIISRPYNLSTRKDDSGKITGYNLTTVYTPFKKDDISIKILNGQLTVSCGKENAETTEDLDYCGISRQSYTFTIPLSENIDEVSVKATAEDGILSIEIPVKKDIPKTKEIVVKID